jgi:hypothetical protein
LGQWHPDTVRRIARNQLYLARRHAAARDWWRILVGQLLWGGVALRHGGGGAWLRGKVEGLRSFRFEQKDPELLGPFMRSSEQFIRKVNFETYWRLYFLLTRGAK